MKLLQHFSDNVSYGLPIGGPASRILAELVLNRTDRLFRSEGMKFCRFVDDYHFFVDSREEAYQALVKISETLYANEGFSLQKSKTRILSSAEFSTSASLVAEDGDPSRASLLSLSLQFDPYSADPEGDYETLRSAVEQVDILGLLTQELAKTRVHSPLTKKLIQAIRFLGAKPKNDAVLSLVNNLDVLAPLFGIVAITIKSLFGDLLPDTRNLVIGAISDQLRKSSHLMKVDLNVAYAARVIALQHTDENEMLLNQIYSRTQSIFVRREVMLAMVKWRAAHWLSDKRRFFSTMSPWERRAFIIGSYTLLDEGEHWRSHVKDSLDPFSLLVRDCGDFQGSCRVNHSRCFSFLFAIDLTFRVEPHHVRQHPIADLS
jgi:Reverse transcriptase (RNA-dependent DNA polymerase)